VPRSRSLPLTETWRYALLGGLASIPFTLGAYWLSGAGDELSLDAVFVGGFLAGYLAFRAGALDAGDVGARAGLIGGVPGAVWLATRVLPDALAAGGTAPFRVGAVAIAVAFPLVSLGFSALAGLIGAKLGAWVASKRLRQRLSRARS